MGRDCTRLAESLARAGIDPAPITDLLGKRMRERTDVGANAEGSRQIPTENTRVEIDVNESAIFPK